MIASFFFCSDWLKEDGGSACSAFSSVPQGDIINNCYYILLFKIESAARTAVRLRSSTNKRDLSYFFMTNKLTKSIFAGTMKEQWEK